MADYRVLVGYTKWIQFSVRAVSEKHAVQKVRANKGNFQGEAFWKGSAGSGEYEAELWKDVEEVE